MAEPQLSVRSAKAREIAHRLAHRKRRSIAHVVERALEFYEQREHGREMPKEFWSRFARDFRVDADFDALIEDHHKAHPGIDL
ncbi:MAG: plasmid stabilization protein [Hyphomicrobiales bacterium]